MEQSQSTPNAVRVCEVFMDVIGEKLGLENINQDHILHPKSVHGVITQVVAFLGAGSPDFRLSTSFETEAKRRELATEVMDQLGCKPKDVKKTLSHNHLDALYAVLKLAK